MPTDLIIGMATGYSWSELYPFVVSLRRSGYDGHCILITGQGPHDEVSRLDKVLVEPNWSIDLKEKLNKYDVRTLDIGKFEEHPGLYRYPVIADQIDLYKHLYRFVLCVDVKDIVFQSDPIIWLNRFSFDREIVVATEGTKYRGSFIGNKKNVIEAFGLDAYNKLHEKLILNAGVIAGRPDSVHNLLVDIYNLCKKDQRLSTFTPTYKDMFPDQSAMNLILRQEPYLSRTLVATDFVFDSGHMQTLKPIFKDGLMYTSFGDVYPIFHQYFCAGVWQEVREKYKECES